MHLQKGIVSLIHISQPFMLLHVDKELTDGIDMVEVANLFVGDISKCLNLNNLGIPIPIVAN